MKKPAYSAGENFSNALRRTFYQSDLILAPSSLGPIWGDEESAENNVPAFSWSLEFWIRDRRWT